MPVIFSLKRSLAGSLVQWPVIILGFVVGVEATSLLPLFGANASLSSFAKVSTSWVTCGESMKWSPPIKAAILFSPVKSKQDSIMLRAPQCEQDEIITRPLGVFIARACSWVKLSGSGVISGESCAL